MSEKTKIVIMSMGYVGLPFAVDFAKTIPVIGFDINIARVEELKYGKDSTLEINEEESRNCRWDTTQFY